MSNRKLMTAVVLLAFLGAAIAVASKPASKSAVIKSSQTNSGGGKATSPNYEAEVTVTVGETAGTASSANYSVDPVIDETLSTGLDWMEFERGDLQ